MQQTSHVEPGGTLNWGLLIAALGGAVLLTWIQIRLSSKRHWLDEPGSRSAHTVPTPTGGGIAMVVPFVLVMLLYLLTGEINEKQLLIFTGCLPIAVTGLLDDLHGLSIGWRLPVQIASAIWVVSLAGQLPALQFGPWNLEIPVLVHILAILSFVWLLNLYNFMDGIDGLAASEAVFVTLLSCLLLLNAGDSMATATAALVCAVALGFLVWNWGPAKIFMGDAGSNFLGYVLGALALTTMANGSMNLWSWLLLLGIFVVDSTYTLIYRFCSGQRWYEGHSCHGYQHAARLLGSHRRVTSSALVINLVWLAPLAWLAKERPDMGLYLALLGLFPLILLVRWLDAGTVAADPVEVS